MVTWPSFSVLISSFSSFWKLIGIDKQSFWIFLYWTKSWIIMMSQIEKYTKNTHAKTHSGYDVDITQIFKVSREGESEQFHKVSLAYYNLPKAFMTFCLNTLSFDYFYSNMIRFFPHYDWQFTTTKNRMLLWHGSRLTNWMGILSQGYFYYHYNHHHHYYYFHVPYF